ncbi:hypothetical protein N431DRAFT_123022 [Stipitochalara longipes BDJ]|nr:hypothetical protein N431DRAFT_123022 [Stipitochalara longipes BDJ]
MEQDSNFACTCWERCIAEVLSTVYFHNAASFRTIMRQSMGARSDHAADASEKPSAARSGDLLPHSRTQNAWRNSQIRPPGRARADLVGYKYRPNSAPIGRWREETHQGRGGVFHLVGNLRCEFQRGAQMKFNNDRPDSEEGLGLGLGLQCCCSLNLPMQVGRGSCRSCVQPRSAEGTPPRWAAAGTKGRARRVGRAGRAAGG